MKIHQGIEKSILESYEELLEAEPSCLAFGDAILKIGIGDLPAGRFVDSIWFHWEESRLQIFLYEGDSEEESLNYRLTLKVGDKI